MAGMKDNVDKCVRYYKLIAECTAFAEDAVMTNPLQPASCAFIQ